MSYIKEKAYAKVNLYLDIIKKRSDGYHEVRTVIQTVSLADELIFEEKSSGISVICDSTDLPCTEENLAYKAAKLLIDYRGINKGISITLKKKIPLFAGLGGGSSNAATTIKSLNKLWHLNLNKEEQLNLAGKLGSDVAFFITGGTVLAEGRGERLVSTLPTPDLWVIILKPDFSISTPWAYSRWKPEMANKNPNFQIFLENLKKGTFLEKKLLYNSFEDIVENDYPLIKNIKDILRKEGIKDNLLSGSGSAVFGLTKDPKLAQRVEKIFKEKKEITCFLTKTIKGNY